MSIDISEKQNIKLDSYTDEDQWSKLATKWKMFK